MQNSFTLQVNGQLVYCHISPCSWMYLGYGLQFSLSLKPAAVNAECKFVHRREVKWEDMAVPVDTARHYAEAWLAENGIAPLVAAIDSWAKASADFDAAMAKQAKRDEKRQKRQDISYRAQGFTHRVVAWIHPKTGDDYQAEWYTKGQPTPAAISRMLVDSCVKTDYQVIAI